MKHVRRMNDQGARMNRGWPPSFILHPSSFILSLLLLGCVQQPPITVSAAVRGEDTAEVSATKDGGTAVMVTNPRGFGTVRIGRQGPQWPSLLAVRLVYSKEKEFQTLHTLTIRAGSNAPGDSMMQGRTGGLGTQDVLFFTGGGAGGFHGSYRIDIQHRARYLQIIIPPELLKHAGDSIELSWVDQM